jgi:exoribonuclease R
MTLKFICEDRDYKSWYVQKELDTSVIELDICPISNKLFHFDTFDISNNKCVLKHSSLRSMKQIPGILVLENNKMFGKYKNKYLYKCIPDDKRIPCFIVPYEIKKVGFEKKNYNKYVLIKFEHWEQKHPFGIIQQVIGGVNQIEYFYEYQLYCKCLQTSIQNFTKQTKNALKVKSQEECFEHICNKNPNIKDRTNFKIFSIDSSTTTDYDDAMSIQEYDDFTVISIYISNVIVWLDALELWDSFAQRISTIYLPDRKRSMLPAILSESLCSLKEKDKRFAFVVDFKIQNDEIISVDYDNCIVNLFKNFVYEEEALKKFKDYKSIKNILLPLSKKYRFLKSIDNSHDVVSYLMIMTNNYCAVKMSSHNNAIYRCVEIKKSEITELPENLPDNVCTFIQVWNNTCGQYKHSNSNGHELLKLDYYIHITSPIRRIVDLLNMIIFMKNENLCFISNDALNFYEKWLKQLDYINTSMRAIRKVQIDCSLLDLCINKKETLEKIYDGYIFDKIERNDGLFLYSVYLPEIKMLSRIYTPCSKNNYDHEKFKLHLFVDQDSLKKKIRLEMII